MSAHVQIKICGLTDPAQARACAEAGVDAIGLVFYPSSPRYVTPGQAREIVAALPAGVTAVGVFVDDFVTHMLDVAKTAGLTCVQLHGREPQEVEDALRGEGLRVIKALRSRGGPALTREAAQHSAVDAWLVEGSRGILPGGNGLGWDWSGAGILQGAGRPFAVAGGLTPENVGGALRGARAAAVDLSSGVEARPGVKDLSLVVAAVDAVRAVNADWPVAPVFGAGRREGSGR